MSIFEPVTLTWKGKEYTIEADRVMRLIAKLEEHVTLAELFSGRPPQAKLSMAYAEALRYAGASVTAEDVYGALFQSDEGAEYAAITQGVLMMMIPPSALQETPKHEGKGKKPGNTKAAKGS